MKEIRAGLTTFATMAYIIAVNASVYNVLRFRVITVSDHMQAALLSQTGGNCECDLENRLKCDTVPSYDACKEG
jgi:AGZA family xanthine/uracil permease-like MFS transporter